MAEHGAPLSRKAHQMAHLIQPTGHDHAVRPFPYPATGPTPGPRELAALAYLIRHGIEYGPRRGERVPRIADEYRTEPNAATMREVHAAMYPEAYRTESSKAEGDRVRGLSAQIDGPLPSYGVDRETISERARRYDIDDRVSRDLERAADAILKADIAAALERGEVPAFTFDSPDVVDRWTLRPEVAPDAAAYRGAAHYRAPAIHRSERRHSLKRSERFFIASTTDVARVSLYRTSIKRADGTTVVYFGCVGPDYYGRKVIVQPKVKRSNGRPTVNLWSAPAATVRSRWARLLKGGSKREPIAPDVVAALVETERHAMATLTTRGRVTLFGATLDAAHDRSVNGRAMVIVRHSDDSRPTMTDVDTLAVRRAILSSL